MKWMIMALLLLVNTSFADNYSVKVKGTKAGKATLTFSEEGGSYQVKLSLFPATLAKMFGIDDMVESAVGKVSKGHYYPVRYQRKETDGKVLMSVDFTSQNVRVKNKKGSRQFTVRKDGQDPLTQILQIRYDLQHRQLKQAYYLVTDSNQRRYRVKRVEEKNGEQIQLTEMPSGDRVITLWFDRQLVLQRMEKTKRGKRDFDIIRQP